MHLFWTCHETSNFWKRVSEWLQSIKLMPETSTLLHITTFGLKPEMSKFALQINYCLLLAQRHIWLAKSKETSPNFDHYLRFLRSRLELETKRGDMEKWEPLAGYIQYLLIDSITSSEAIAAIFQYLQTLATIP